MAQKDRATLRTQAEEIRDESIQGANTAVRVGGMNVDEVDSMLNIIDDQALYDQSQGVLDNRNDLNIHKADVANPHSTEFENLVNRDGVEQGTAGIPNVSGSVALDMFYNHVEFTLTGNITGFTFNNNPPINRRKTAVLNIYQDGTGSHTVDFAGFYPLEGTDNAALQPQITAFSLTQYYLYWTGTYWIIFDKKEISLISL